MDEEERQGAAEGEMRRICRGSRRGQGGRGDRK